MERTHVIGEIVGEREVKRYFETWLEIIVRVRLPLTVIFIKAVTSNETNGSERQIEEQISTFLQSKIRKTDVLFQVSGGKHWGIFFPQSSAVEAKAFLKRIFSNLKEEKSNIIELKASVTEIRNNDITLEALINRNKQLLFDDEQLSWTIQGITDYSVPPTELVKVSIIEQNDIFRHVLESTLRQLDLPNFIFEVATYEDGYSFLEDNRYKSGHIHFILMNDILPRQNGFEILHNLRKMPNSKKFIIYMMSERNYEDAMLNAYEGGVDEYIVKPLNLRLLEAKIKRTFARFWL